MVRRMVATGTASPPHRGQVDRARLSLPQTSCTRNLKPPGGTIGTARKESCHLEKSFPVILKDSKGRTCSLAYCSPRLGCLTGPNSPAAFSGITLARHQASGQFASHTGMSCPLLSRSVVAACRWSFAIWDSATCPHRPIRVGRYVLVAAGNRHVSAKWNHNQGWIWRAVDMRHDLHDGTGMPCTLCRSRHTGA